jgi:predicted metalloprotease with PDZ domain
LKSLTPQKNLKTFAVAFFCLLILNLAARGQTLEVQIEVLPESKISVKGKFLETANPAAQIKRWTFLDVYADARNLAARFSAPTFLDAAGQSIVGRKIAAFEFETTDAINSFQYEANLAVPAETTAAAHVSWLAQTHGLLMLSDLLPQFSGADKVSARVKFVLPDAWQIFSIEKKTGNKIVGDEFLVEDVERAVFLAGNGFQARTSMIGKTEFQIVMRGDWSFTETEALDMATRILEEHRRTFGEFSVGRAQLFLLPFPRSETKSDRWRAETRGSSIILLSGSMPFKSLALSRLHEQLRHEIFHLWIPNSVNLTGQYDWFYEGFTLYQALKTGVKLEFIRFEDYLDTMSRAFDAARAMENGTPQISLVEASRNRWHGSGNLVYAKGMLVAFLCDAAILRESGGKKSLTDVFREINQKYGRAAATPREDGNAAVIAALKRSKATAEIARKFVENGAAVEWTQEIAALGLQNAAANGFTRLVVSKNLNGRQKNLLEKLGFKRDLVAE